MIPDDRPEAGMERRLRSWLREPRPYERHYATRSIEEGLRRSEHLPRPTSLGRVARVLSMAGALVLVVVAVGIGPMLIGPPAGPPPPSRTPPPSPSRPPLPPAAEAAERTLREAGVPVSELAIAVATLDDAVWVLTQQGYLHEFEAQSGAERGSIEVGGNGCGAIAAAGSQLWFRVCPPGPALERTEIVQVDAATRRIVGRVAFPTPVGDAPAAVPEGLWVITDPEAGELAFVAASTSLVSQRIELGESLEGVAAGGGSVWVTLRSTLEVAEVDVAGGSFGRRVPLDHAAGSAIVDGGALWVGGRNEIGTGDDGWLWRIDVRTGAIDLTLVVGAAGVTQLAAAEGGVWVLLGAEAIRIAMEAGVVADRIAVGPTSVSAPPQFVGSTRALAPISGGVWFVAPRGSMRLLSSP